MDNRKRYDSIGSDPARARESSSRFERRVTLQTLSPRVQDHQPTNRGAQTFRIPCDLEQRLSGRVKHQVVHHALIDEREPGERLRHREDEVDITGKSSSSRAATHAFRAAVRHSGNADRGSCCTRGPAAHTAHSDRDARRAPRYDTGRSRGAHADAVLSPTRGGCPGIDRHVGAQCRPPRRVAASPLVQPARAADGVTRGDRHCIKRVGDRLQVPR